MFATTSGTIAYNSIFLNDDTTCICLNRSAHFHPIQTMIERMKGLKNIYVDVFIFSSRRNFGDAPCLLAPTRFLFNFYKSESFSFDKFSHFKKMPKYFIDFIWLNITLWLPRKLIRLYYQMINSDWTIIRFMGKSIRLCYKRLFWKRYGCLRLKSKKEKIKIKYFALGLICIQSLKWIIKNLLEFN